MKKKIIFWVIAALLIIGISCWLKFASVGATMMTLIVGAVCLAGGWVFKGFYDKYIAKN